MAQNKNNQSKIIMFSAFLFLLVTMIAAVIIWKLQPDKKNNSVSWKLQPDKKNNSVSEENYKDQALVKTTDCTYWYRYPGIIREYGTGSGAKMALMMVRYQVGDYYLEVPYSVLNDVLDSLRAINYNYFNSPDNIDPVTFRKYGLAPVRFQEKIVKAYETVKNKPGKYQLVLNDFLSTPEDKSFFLNVFLYLVEDGQSFLITSDGYNYGYLLVAESGDFYKFACHDFCVNEPRLKRAAYVEFEGKQKLVFELIRQSDEPIETGYIDFGGKPKLLFEAARQEEAVDEKIE